MARRGPGYVLDDWFLLANAHFDGWWRALGGDLARARPGSAVVYAASFGLVGRHPMVALALQTVLAAAAATSLRWLLLRFVPPTVATGVAALWVVLPNHGSLLYWTTGTAITVALILLLVGLRLHSDGHTVPGALCLAASVLTYEATAPAALAGLVVAPLLLGRSWRRELAIGGAFVVPAVAWAITAIPDVKRGLGQSPELGQVLPAHVGWGVFPVGVIATGLGLGACVAGTLLLVESARRRRLATESAMVLAGIVTILLGTLPFLRYFYAPLGAGDRVNVVAGVGTALVWAGLLRAVASRCPRAVAVGCTAVVVAAMAVAGWQSAGAWADAVDEGEDVLAALRPVEAGARIVVPRSTLRRNVAPFLDDSNLLGAVQLEAGTRDVDARLTAPAP